MGVPFRLIDTLLIRVVKSPPVRPAPPVDVILKSNESRGPPGRFSPKLNCAAATAAAGIVVVSVRIRVIVTPFALERLGRVIAMKSRSVLL